LRRDALVQTHCHDTAVLDPAAGHRLLSDMGLRVAHPDSGCCGMAGSFGYEQGERHRVSVAAGERVILPAVRAADPETIIVADGFSCREQIAQLAGRRPLHLAQLLWLAHEHGPEGSPSVAKGTSHG
jgi:Fe-S oxidoreductase